MTAITLVLGESRIVGELMYDDDKHTRILPVGASNTTTLTKSDGWQIEQPPFVFPTARSAVIAPVDEGKDQRWFLDLNNGDPFWYDAEFGGSVEESRIRALNIPLRVIFAGEVE